MSQHRRWGLLAEDPDYLAVARAVNQLDLYAEAASALGIALPHETIRRSVLCDGRRWDGESPAEYAQSFALHHCKTTASARDTALTSRIAV
jgi:hypothetical protein